MAFSIGKHEPPAYTKASDIPKAQAPNGYFVGVNAVIDHYRWASTYPYQLMLVEVVEGLTSADIKDLTGSTDNPARTPSYQLLDKSATFTLPIPPQEMSITLPFASMVTPTFGSVVEDHSGAPFRNISLAGTTGLAPFRLATESAATPSVLESVFSGTLNAVDNLVDNAKQLLGVQEDPPNIHKGEQGLDAGLGIGGDGIPYESTGYFQFRLLQQFLETYSAMKANGDHPELRLVFANHKDEAFYVVTPITFQLRRSMQSPWEYKYIIQFKAWKRIDLDVSISPFANRTPAVRDSGILGDIANKVNQVRQTIQSATGVVNAALGDVDRIMNIAREVSMIARDLANLANTLADLPTALAQSVGDGLGDMGDNLSSAATDLSNFPQRLGQNLSNMGNTFNAAYSGAGQKAGIARARAGASDPLPPRTAAIQQALAAPTKNFQALNSLPLSSVPMKPQAQEALASERKRLRELKRVDYEDRRSQVIQFADNYADAIGAGDTTYNTTYGRAAPKTRTPRYEEMKVLWALQSLAQQLDRFAASQATDTVNKPTSLEYVKQLADRSGIEFILPRSKFVVPFPYGATLESLAAQYLDTPNRWHEIAVLNRLRAPYVDEEGFRLGLAVNGDQNIVVVNDATNLYQGQTVWLVSNTQARDKRHIEGIRKIAEGNIIVVLDGDPDLDKFTVNSEAFMHAFLPNTTNSQGLIFIPSQDDDIRDTSEPKFVPGVDDYDNLLKIGGIDLLLDSGNDLILENGDAKFAFGLSNIIQTVRLGLSTPRGSLLQHPGYGLAVKAGDSHADVTAQDILKSVEDTFKNDPTFSRINSVQVAKVGPTVRIGVSVSLAGTAQMLPISFALPNV